MSMSYLYQLPLQTNLFDHYFSNSHMLAFDKHEVHQMGNEVFPFYHQRQIVFLIYQ